MKEWLIKLHPERFEDLIAMNALYRPGPMDYIPDFVAGKNDPSKIHYDLPEMEELLKETYGVTVYQEQVMRLSQKLAGFSKGKADKLRKAMGKKQKAVLDSLKESFMKGALANGHPEPILQKIWSDWEAFAKYAFNKSHATCYAWVSYQTAWIKAHYPSEFQASNLTQNISNMEEMKEIMADCRKAGIKVLSPDVNESDAQFSVNKTGDIRYGLGGLKGFGENVVEAIIRERKAGANGELCIDEIVKYDELYRNDTMDSAKSLFGETEELRPERPEIPAVTGEDELALLQKEKELVGMYLSSHPLDKYEFEMKQLISCELSRLGDLVADCERQKKPCKVSVAGLVTDAKILTTKTGRPWSKTIIEDYSGSYELALFGKDHEEFMQYMTPHAALYIDAEIGEKFRLRPEEVKAGKSVPYALRIKKVRLLGNVGEDFFGGVAVDIDTPMLSDSFRKEFIAVLKRHKGSFPLR